MVIKIHGCDINNTILPHLESQSIQNETFVMTIFRVLHQMNIEKGKHFGPYCTLEFGF